VGFEFKEMSVVPTGNFYDGICYPQKLWKSGNV